MIDLYQLPGSEELYRKVICDVTSDDKSGFEEECKSLVTEISDQNNMLTKLRSMLLSDDIDMQDYKIMKAQCEEKIMKLEAELKDLKERNAVKTDLTEIVDEALIRLKRLTELYSLGTIEDKRYIIGSIFPEKLRIFDYDGRTAIMNPAVQLIYLINKNILYKKSGVKISKNLYSAFVLQKLQFSDHFLEDIELLGCLIA